MGLDELTAWRLRKLAERADQTPRDYLRDVLFALWDAAQDNESAAVLIVDQSGKRS